MVLFFSRGCPAAFGYRDTARLNSEHCGFGHECWGPAGQSSPRPHGAPLTSQPRGQEQWPGQALPRGRRSLWPTLSHRRLCSRRTTPGSLLKHFPVSTEMTETGSSPRPSWEDFLEVGAGGRAGLGSDGEFPGGPGGNWSSVSE